MNKNTWITRAGAIAATGALVFGATACSGGSGGGGGQGETPRVGFLIHNMQGNAWLAAAADEAKKAAEENGMQVTVTDGRGDVAQMNSTINDYIAQGMDAIVIVPPDADSLAEAVKRADAKDVPVVAFSLNFADGTPTTAFVGTDEIEIGRGLGQLTCEALDGKGNVAEQTGIIGSTAQIGRSEGLKLGLEENCPDVEIVESQPDNWMQDKTVSLTQDWLVKYPESELGAIVSHGPQVTAAATTAAGKGRDEIAFVATDYPEEVRQAIIDGSLYGAVAQYPREMSKATFEGLKQLFDGGEMDKEILTEVGVISKENVDDISAAY